MINKFFDNYRFLSNFWMIPVELDGLHYNSVEHAYQAAKTLDLDERIQFYTCGTPGDAKRLGKKITLRKDWNKVKVNIMDELVRKKFKDSYLKFKLFATGDQELVEGNMWHDNFWGDCFCKECQHIKGFNHLGRILMEIRDRENERSKTKNKHKRQQIKE